jgi:hypothetical protein
MQAKVEHVGGARAEATSSFSANSLTLKEWVALEEFSKWLLSHFELINLSYTRAPLQYTPRDLLERYMEKDK